MINTRRKEIQSLIQELNSLTGKKYYYVNNLTNHKLGGSGKEFDSADNLICFLLSRIEELEK